MTTGIGGEGWGRYSCTSRSVHSRPPRKRKNYVRPLFTIGDTTQNGRTKKTRKVTSSLMIEQQYEQTQNNNERNSIFIYFMFFEKEKENNLRKQKIFIKRS